MGWLSPNIQETNLYSNMLLEAARMLGTNIKIKFIESVDLDIYTDPKYVYKPPKELDMLLEEHPRQKFLRDLHWYNEDEEIQPLLAYLSKRDYDNFNIEALIGIIIELPYVIDDKVRNKTYKVMEAKAFGPGPFFWILKLVPLREEYKPIPPVDHDSNYNYLNVRMGEHSFAVGDDITFSGDKVLEGVYYFNADGNEESSKDDN